MDLKIGLKKLHDINHHTGLFYNYVNQSLYNFT